MKKSTCIIFMSLAWLLLACNQAEAYTTGTDYLCVDGSNGAANISDDFQDALKGATSTHSKIRLPSGNYPISGVAGVHFNATATHSLDISGGWNAVCSVQTEASPELTTLAGGTTQTGTGDNASGGVLSVTIDDNASAATFSIHNLTIRNGSSTGSGGGLYFLHTGNSGQIVTVNIHDLIVADNETATNGAGMQIQDNGTERGMFVNIHDCVVSDNIVTAVGGGPGGISVEVPSPDGAKMADTFISNCQILDNSSDKLGGGVYINSGTGETILTNNIIAGNSVSNDNGGGVYILNSEGGGITLTNNTITDNETADSDPGEEDGGGLYVDLANATSGLDVYNNIIFNNIAAGNGDDIFISRPYPNEIHINNNDFNTTNTGFLIDGDKTISSNSNNLNIDPEFEDPGNTDTNDNDYHLQDTSPAINAGENLAPELPEKDIEGNDRIQDTTVDMGAYEFPGTPGGGGGGSDSGVVEGGEGCFITTAQADISMAGDDTLKSAAEIAFTPQIFIDRHPLAAGFVCMLLGIFLVGGLGKSKK